MYQSSSSSSSKSHVQKKKSSPACPPETKMKRKNQQFRNVFQDLNNVASDDTSSSSNASSMSSIEAPKGCLRFFLSHTSNKTNSNANHGPSRAKLPSTPKSAPSLRPAKENSSRRFNFHKPVSQKCKMTPPRVSSSKISSASKNSSVSAENELNKLKSGFREVEKVAVGFDVSDLTPPSKTVNGVVKDGDGEKSKSNCNYSNSNTNSSGSKTKTPPVQASVSPEIQCGSSMLTTGAKTITPVCYGAGYVMSGVTDKRKCRPRGILTIGEAKPLSCFDSDDEIEEEGIVPDSVMSALPLPSEASVHWLLSPCNEEDEDKKEDSETELCGFPNFPTSCSPGSVILSPNMGVNNTGKVFSRGFMGPPLYDKSDVLCLEEEKKNCSDLAEETSQLSPASLSSGNVIQTPQSDCSSGRQVGISSSNADIHRERDNTECKLNSMAERIQMASLSPKSYVSIWDPAGSSFVFDCLSTPFNSVDLSHFQKVLDDRTSWLTNSTMENVSESQTRISWREGLVSRMFEMDEFDSCRCLSDAEDDANCLESHCSPGVNVDVVNELIPTNDSGSSMDVESGHGSDRQAKKELSDQVPYSCAESISTDAGSLVRSEDSDWTMCYKNKLFH